MNADTFTRLRHEAKIKRNRAIAAARKEYDKTLHEIEALESKLASKPDRRRGSSLSKVIMEVLPDHAVTIDDCIALIKAADPTREFKRETIRTVLHKLWRRGSIRKVTDASGSRVASYALPSVDVPDDKSLADWARDVLSKSRKPMKAVEILVQMTERGYVMECPPNESVRHLVWAMDKSHDFSQKSRLWTLG